ncbi:hypothetical protein [Peterkaempfera griseoplana]|uniref:hypothetical protein n=1 Tax=Peterkaempfera griseoplana TaxID=66896 RepID=UPI000ADCE6D6|nr:hypothetical protein [Peterkaempfera griseoplana]
MGTELAELASAGAATLVGLMISDSWTQVKGTVGRLFARGHTVDATLQELETSRTALLSIRDTNDDLTATAIETMWRARLHRLMLSDPSVTTELTSLLRSIDSQPSGGIHNTISGGIQNGIVIQSGNISGSTFHVPTPPRGASPRTSGR